MKKISIVSPCYNEEKNLQAVYQEVKKQFADNLKTYDYEHIFIDNRSTDESPSILRSLAQNDLRVKVIFNSRNFGHIRSPVYALYQATGDAVILLVSDLQDPPNLIPELIKKWEEGNKIVVAIKKESEESALMFGIRTLYYNIINKISETKLAKNYTGFGIYDKKVIDVLKSLDDPYPYLRGLIFKVGFKTDHIYYVQPKRKRGVTKNNFYTLYDLAMLGICTHSKVPLRFFTITGFITGGISLFISLIYLMLKLILWDNFKLGMAPLIIGLFFFSAIQIFSIGIIGEYIGLILTKVTKEPLVIEEERLNF
ncbi:MAG: glycosyltransferase family 2 protein [Bacteriovorax sp.]|nr:glycosyltransferase family 2 protein [Bacteriovorax sp.]